MTIIAEREPMLVTELTNELADGAKSMTELVDKLGEGVRDLVLVMADLGGLAVITTQDGTRIYGLSGDG